MSVAIISYASGIKWKGARKRLLRTKNSSIFNGEIYVFDQEWLLSKNKEFRKHLNFVKTYEQGAGLWLWKPFLIETCFVELPGVNQFIYIDAGCEINLNKDSIKRLRFYLDATSKTGGVFFQLSHTERDFTSIDLLNLYDSELDVVSGQIHATCFILDRSQESQKLLSNWIKLATTDHYKYLVGINTSNDFDLANKFTHRHDQSILSFLVKSSQFTILPDETYFEPFWRKSGRAFPFWATRNRHLFNSTYGMGYLITTLVSIYRKVKKL
jgi:hypothetical protein